MIISTTARIVIRKLNGSCIVGRVVTRRPGVVCADQNIALELIIRNQASIQPCEIGVRSESAARASPSNCESRRSRQNTIGEGETQLLSTCCSDDKCTPGSRS